MPLLFLLYWMACQVLCYMDIKFIYLVFILATASSTLGKCFQYSIICMTQRLSTGAVCNLLRNQCILATLATAFRAE